MKQYVDLRDSAGKTIEKVAFGHSIVVIGFADETYTALRACMTYDNDVEIESESFAITRADSTYIYAGVISEDEYAEFLRNHRQRLEAADRAKEMAIYERVKARLEGKS